MVDDPPRDAFDYSEDTPKDVHRKTELDLIRIEIHSVMTRLGLLENQLMHLNERVRKLERP